MFNQLGHRSASRGDDRSSTRHRFDHRQSKWFLEVDQVQKGACVAKGVLSLLPTDRAVIGYMHAGSGWHDCRLIVLAVLHDAVHVQMMPTKTCDFDRLRGALVGMDSPEEKQVIADIRIERKIIDWNAVMNG